MNDELKQRIILPKWNSDAIADSLRGDYGTLYYNRSKFTFTYRYDSPDDNVDTLRKHCPRGLHFVVGDTHGETQTLMNLMGKIRFDPEHDHVYFVGDYNAGGNVHTLLRYMSAYYQADPEKPGFHMIRGNHEREHYPVYTLENLPDLYVIRMPQLTYYIAHAGMVQSAFRLIAPDVNANDNQRVFAYGFDDCCVAYDAPLRQVMHSRNGLYDPRRKVWPGEHALRAQHACIIHGHSPYSFFRHAEYDSYGGRNLFWLRQHVFFSEQLQSFNIDSDVKGRCENGQTYRGLSCVCLEVLEEIAAQNDNGLTIENNVNAPNAVFGVPYAPGWDLPVKGDVETILNAAPKMRSITLDKNNQPCFA